MDKQALLEAAVRDLKEKQAAYHRVRAEMSAATPPNVMDRLATVTDELRKAEDNLRAIQEMP